MGKTVFKGIHAMKLIMAYLVVAIHTTDWSLMGLLDTAVPFFFLVSGFFLFRKLGGTRAEDLTVIRSWIGKTLQMYLLWTLIYLPFTFIGFHRDGLPLTSAIALFLRNLVLVGENYLSWPLWYLLAMVWGGILIWLMRWLRIPVWGMFLVGLTLYLSAYFFQLDSVPAYVKLFKTTRNGIFLGLMFLTAGGLIHRWTEHGPKLSIPQLWDLLLIAIGFAAYQFSPLFLLPLAAGLFLLAYRTELPLIDDRTAILMGGMSKYIYLTHMIFAGLAILLAGMTTGWPLWLLSSACATALAALFAGPLKNTRINQWLFNEYNRDSYIKL